MSDDKLTQKIRANHEQCPFCRSDMLDEEITRSESDGITFMLPVNCEVCGRTWHKFYQFTHAKKKT